MVSLVEIPDQFRQHVHLWQKLIRAQRRKVEDHSVKPFFPVSLQPRRVGRREKQGRRYRIAPGLSGHIVQLLDVAGIRGVPRAQRIPETEAQGRIHTSTATVAVMPEPDDVEVNVNSGELRIDIYHAGGHGGQNVNKVATAIRITHLPTGLVVQCQNERSQLQNKLQGMEILRSRLWDMELRKRQAEESANRKAQVGTGDRSEKIRTYNFPQSRITDHRIGYTSHQMQNVMSGQLDDFIDALLQEEQARKLAAVGD